MVFSSTSDEDDSGEYVLTRSESISDATPCPSDAAETRRDSTLGTIIEKDTQKQADRILGFSRRHFLQCLAAGCVCVGLIAVTTGVLEAEAEKAASNSSANANLRHSPGYNSTVPAVPICTGYTCSGTDDTSMT